MLKRLAKELCVYILAGVVIWFCIITISGGESVKLGISEAVDRCMNIIIPSLFVFMALSQILVSSGLYYCVSMPFYPISRFIMGIPPQLFFVFLLGNTAGYPVGVKLLSDLCQRKIISQRTAKIMSCFCCCGGPAFYSGTVGLAVFGCTGAGIAVFVSILAANFLTALVLGRAINGDKKTSKPTFRLDGRMFTDSVISAGKSLFVICVMIVFFGAFMSSLEYCGAFSFLKNAFSLSENELVLVKSCLEITSLTELSGSPFYLLPFIAAVCSFGGLCVIIQIAALGVDFSLVPFFISRLVSAFLSAVICRFIYPFFIPDSVLTAVTNNVKFVKVNNFVPSFCLIMMILLLTLKKRLVQRRNVQIRIQDLHLTVGLNVAGGNCAGTHRLDIDGLAGITMELGQQALDVQNDLRHILLDAGDGGKLVLHTVDLDGRRRSAGQRGKQNAAQGVAEGGAIAALQRLYHVLAISDVSRGLDALDLGLLNFDHAVTLLHLVIAVTRSSRVPLAVRTILRGYPPNYLEYNSTMRCSSTGVSISSRVGR